MPSALLSLCARAEGHDLQRSQLVKECFSFKEWDKLLYQAEVHGMGPLLYRHLSSIESNAPQAFLRDLRFLCLRHEQANRSLIASLRNIIALFEDNGVPCIILKGAALCQTLYADTGHRPMRDIDLLFAKQDVHHANALLLKNGFHSSNEQLPEGYFHLPPLLQKTDGIQVCIELHHGLFPYDPPYYNSLHFEDLYKNSLTFDMQGLEVRTLAHEEMLWHLYQHGLHAPLTYEPYKLISVADIVSLVEKKNESLDWEKIQKNYPQLLKILPLLHYLTPWNESLQQKLLPETSRAVAKVGEPYKGWPRTKLARKGDKTLLLLLRSTFIPSHWWIMVYYGIDGFFSLMWCRFVRHPMHLLRWVKVYSVNKVKRMLC